MSRQGKDTKKGVINKVAVAVVSASLLLLSILALRIVDTAQYIHLGVLLKAIARLWPIAG
jgi:hypothetical protein